MTRRGRRCQCHLRSGSSATGCSSRYCELSESQSRIGLRVQDQRSRQRQSVQNNRGGRTNRWPVIGGADTQRGVPSGPLSHSKMDADGGGQFAEEDHYQDRCGSLGNSDRRRFCVSVAVCHYNNRMATTNRLASESSLYLRQHANNPVDWYPWGPEALASPRNSTGRSFFRSATRRATGAT